MTDEMGAFYTPVNTMEPPLVVGVSFSEEMFPHDSLCLQVGKEESGFTVAYLERREVKSLIDALNSALSIWPEDGAVVDADPPNAFHLQGSITAVGNALEVLTKRVDELEAALRIRKKIFSRDSM